MKQHITVEQLNELTNEQKERLREWWQPQEGDKVLFGNDAIVFVIESTRNDYLRPDHMKINNAWLPIKEGKNSYYSLLSIGQCFQLLRDFDYFEEGYFDECGLYNHNNKLDVQIGIIWVGMWRGNELIDALWEAVKETL